MKIEASPIMVLKVGLKMNQTIVNWFAINSENCVLSDLEFSISDEITAN